jgi:hypothetical protein
MSAGHSHAPSADEDIGQPAPRARRLTLALLITAALATLVAMVLLWPHPSRSAEAAPPDRVNGEVTAVQPIDCAKDPEAQVPTGEESPSGAATICGTVAVRLTSGPEAGKDITTDIPAGPGAITVARGDDIELLYLPDSPDGQLYSIYDHQRSTQLWVLAAAFALAVIALAGGAD